MPKQESTQHESSLTIEMKVTLPIWLIAWADREAVACNLTFEEYCAQSLVIALMSENAARHAIQDLHQRNDSFTAKRNIHDNDEQL